MNKVALNLLLDSKQTDNFPNPQKFWEEVEGGVWIFKKFSLPQNGTSLG